MRDRGQEFVLSVDDLYGMSPLTNEKLGIELPSDWECFSTDCAGGQICCSDEFCFENGGCYWGDGGISPFFPAAIRIRKGTTINDVENGDYESAYGLWYSESDNGKLYCVDGFDDNEPDKYCSMFANTKISDGLWEM